MIALYLFCCGVQNIEMKVEVESLKKELVERQELLKKAWYVVELSVISVMQSTVSERADSCLIK